MGGLPASWIPPTVVLEWRERVRLYKTLVDQRSTWVQRIHAELYQHGVALPETSIRWAKTHERLLQDDGLGDRAAGRQRVLSDAIRMIDAITVESRPLKADLQRFGLRQPGCRALVDSQYGIGGLLAVALWSELGDCQRFARSEQVVRHSGLGVIVDQSDRRRAGGFLSHQGPPTLRWALYEAAKNASHQRSPDPRPTTPTSRITSTASWRPSRWPASSPDAASTCCERSAPDVVYADALTTFVESDGPAPPTFTSRVVSQSSSTARACPPAFVLDGLQNIDTTTVPSSVGDTQSEM